MGKVLRFVNGYPKSVEEAASSAQAAIDAHIADTTGAHAASAISIVDSANQFTGVNVETALAEALDAAQAAQADATQALSDAAAASPTIWEGEYTASGSVTAGTAITLPSSKTYTGAELQVFFSGYRLFEGTTKDFNYVGSGARTQISLNFDLISGEKLQFVIDRKP